MVYCKNCGAALTEGARFCASCGTPVQTEQAYINMPPAGNMQAENGEAGYPGGEQAFNGQGMNAMPFAPEKQNGAVYQNMQAAGQAYGGDIAPQGGGMMPYTAGQVYGGSVMPYAAGQAYGNDASVYAAGGGYAENPYDPYGKAVQLQSSRKALMIVGMTVGLIVVAAVILLTVLLTRDKSHRTYQQVTGVFMDGLEEQDLERMSEAFPERVREDIRRRMQETLIYEYAESRSAFHTESEFWAQLNEVLEWYCGENITMSYTITETEPIEDYRLREYERDFLENFHYGVSLSDGYTVKIEVVHRGSEGEYGSRLSLKTAEISGKWYVIGLN